jgi:hypothetical protein
MALFLDHRDNHAFEKRRAPFEIPVVSKWRQRRVWWELAGVAEWSVDSRRNQRLRHSQAIFDKPGTAQCRRRNVRRNRGRRDRDAGRPLGGGYSAFRRQRGNY